PWSEVFAAADRTELSSMSVIDPQSLARALGGEASGNNVRAPSPGHSAGDRSLSIRVDPGAPDGLVINSFSGHDWQQCKDYVREKAGLEPFKPNGQRRYNGAGQPQGKIVAEYDYADENGTLLYQVVRNDPKDFRQRRPDGNGGWIWNLDGVRRVPYRLSEVLQYPDATVFFCEGEKDADRVASLGHCATTVASGKWSDDCVKALAGRDIIILQDNDDAGAKKALAAARAVGVDAKTGEAIFAPHILWEDNHVDVTAAEAMATAKSPAARDEAKKFLTDTLANGPVLKAEIEDAADANGISERTLFRAKVSLALCRGRMARTEPGLGGFRRGPRRRLPRRRGATEREWQPWQP
ncbi:MAG: hypothetical protein WB689_07500, partial [Xanthobacteraceae bacterium]